MWVDIQLGCYYEAEDTLTQMKPNQTFFQVVNHFLFVFNNIYRD